jgi:acetate kinase
MNVLLLNAGSSSQKATVMASADGTVVARGLSDWAGSVTHYQYAGPDGKDRSEDVPWKGHARAARGPHRGKEPCSNAFQADPRSELRKSKE